MQHLKNFVIILLMLTMLLILPINVKAQKNLQMQNIEYKVILYVIDYMTNLPLTGVNMTIIMSNSMVITGLTDDFGSIKTTFKETEDLIDVLEMNKIIIYDNLTIIKIQDYMVENLQYDCHYTNNFITYSGLKIRPKMVKSENQILFYYYIFVLQAKLVHISDFDPLMIDMSKKDYLLTKGEKLNLEIEPAVPVDKGSNIYETAYLVPINYTVSIKVYKTSWIYGYKLEEMSIKTTITKNTSYINVMGPIMNLRLESSIKPLKNGISLFELLGLSVINEERLLARIDGRKKHILELVENREYRLAFSSLKFLINDIKTLENNLSNLYVSFTLTFIIIMTFICAFSFLISTLITEHNKKKFALRFALYFSIFFIFLLAYDEFKAVLLMIASNIMLIDVSHVDNFTLLLVSVIFGSLPILTLNLISLYSPPIIGLGLNLSIRDIKKRFLRSILTILVLSLIIFSILAVFRVTYGRIIHESVTLVNFKGPIIYLQSTKNNIIFEEDLIFLKSEDWINLTYPTKSLDESLIIPGINGFPVIELKSSDFRSNIKIFSINPDFLKDYFNFSLMIIRGGYLTSGEKAVLVPNSLNKWLNLGDSIRLTFIIKDPIYQVNIFEYDLGRFSVKGFFDSYSVSNIALPDGSPLIASPYWSVIIPDDVLPDFIDVSSFSEQLQHVNILKINHVFLIPDPNVHIDIYEKAKELMRLTSYKTSGFSNGKCVTFEELHVLNIVGVSYIIPPVIISALIVLLTMNSMMYERNREIRMLSILGGSPRVVMNIFMMEAIIIGVLSIAIGYICYTGVYASFKWFTPILQSWSVELGNIFIEMEIASGFNLPSVLAVLFIGLAVPVIGNYVPCIKYQGLTLLGRSPKRNVKDDIRKIDDTAEYALPIRVSFFDSEMLYEYLKSQFFVKRFQPKMLSGNFYKDGTFDFNFVLEFHGSFIKFTLRGIKRGDIIYPVLSFPVEYSESVDVHRFIYNLEKASLSYTTWKERHIRLKIVRVKPITRVRMIDDILRDIKIIREQLHVLNNKLRVLERLKATTPANLLVEYEKRYISQIKHLNRSIRQLGLELEPFYNKLNDEARKLSIEIEKLNIAHKLGEISDDEYESSVRPLREKFDDIQKKLNNINFIFTQLKMPKIRLSIKTVERSKKIVGTPVCPFCGSINVIRRFDGVMICGKCNKKLK